MNYGLDAKTIHQILPANIPSETYTQLDKGQTVALRMSEIGKRTFGSDQGNTEPCVNSSDKLMAYFPYGL